MDVRRSEEFESTSATPAQFRKENVRGLIEARNLADKSCTQQVQNVCVCCHYLKLICHETRRRVTSHK